MGRFFVPVLSDFTTATGCRCSGREAPATRFAILIWWGAPTLYHLNSIVNQLLTSIRQAVM